MNEPDLGTLVPVTLLTGFLGSGKTTVLNRQLRRPGMEGALVIVNEFGEVGLDHLLIETSEERFALLDNGCVCCTVRGDLVETLKDIARRADAGQLPALKRVLIETTGLADPAPVLHTLMAEPELAGRFHIGGVVTTVDAVNGISTIEQHAEAAKQVAVADRVLITKTDLAEAADLTQLARRLQQLSPAAEINVVTHGEVGPVDILDAGVSAEERSAALTASLARADAAIAPHDHACGPHCGHDHTHGHDHHTHDHAHAHHGIQSYSFVIDEPVDWQAFALWLDYIAMLRGEDLLRMKGIIHVASDPDHPVVVHGVQHVFHPPMRLDAWPSADRCTRLVFIVRGIPRETIERTLVKFAALGAAAVARPPERSAA
jgi:G3E family GTPase